MEEDGYSIFFLSPSPFPIPHHSINNPSRLVHKGRTIKRAYEEKGRRVPRAWRNPKARRAPGRRNRKARRPERRWHEGGHRGSEKSSMLKGTTVGEIREGFCDTATDPIHAWVSLMTLGKRVVRQEGGWLVSPIWAIPGGKRNQRCTSGWER